MGEAPEHSHDGVQHKLDDWRDAERDAANEKPGSAARKMARKRADAARDDFHEAEDVERKVQGNYRPRKKGEPELGDAESTG